MLQKWKWRLLSPVQFFGTPWSSLPLSMGFSRQESWSGLPFFSLKKQPIGLSLSLSICVDWVYYKKSMWWCKLSLMTCCLHTGDPGKAVVSFSLNQKAWESGEVIMWFPVWKEEKTHVRHRQNILPSLHFHSTQPSMDWVMPTHIGEGHLLYSVYWF